MGQLLAIAMLIVVFSTVIWGLISIYVPVVLPTAINNVATRAFLAVFDVVSFFAYINSVPDLVIKFRKNVSRPVVLTRDQKRRNRRITSVS